MTASQERGPEALGDPVEYARELRAAAGIPVGAKAPRGLAARVEGLLDAGHARFDAVVARSGEVLRTDLRPVVAWLWPLWWIVRAWAVAWAINEPLGLTMGDAPGLVALVVAVAVSMFIGVGRIWPGGERGTGARVVLLLVNLLAAFVLFIAWASSGDGGVEYDRGWNDGYSEATGVTSEGAPIEDRVGIYSGDKRVTNIYPYDASGKPLTGVQLYDQAGTPLEVGSEPDCISTDANPLPRIEESESTLDTGELESPCYDEMSGELLQSRVFYPWSNGATQLYNVFPLPSRLQPDGVLDPSAYAAEDPPTVEAPPLATVPKATLPSPSPTP